MIGPVRLQSILRITELTALATYDISQTPGYIKIILKPMCELKYPIENT